jgi:hypothetical protein
MLDRHSWFTKWCEPLVVALYQRDVGAISQSITSAHDALESGQVQDEGAACLDFQLAYLEFQAQPVLKEPGWKTNKLPQLIARLMRRSEYSAAERLRRRLYLQLRIILDRAGIQQLHPVEFDEAFSELQHEEHTTELWHYIASWAFLYDQADFLRQAYEFAVTRARGFEVEWTWQRVNLMWKLVCGDASRADLMWLLNQAHTEQQLQSVKKMIWQRAQRLGLIDEAVRVRFRERELEFEVEANATVGQHLRPHMANPANLAV